AGVIAAFYYQLQDNLVISGSAGLGVGIKSDGTQVTLAGYATQVASGAPNLYVFLDVNPVSGNGFIFTLDDGTGAAAPGQATGAAYDAAGNVYVTDTEPVTVTSGTVQAAVLRKFGPTANIETTPPSFVWGYAFADDVTGLNFGSNAVAVGADG